MSIDILCKSIIRGMIDIALPHNYARLCGASKQICIMYNSYRDKWDESPVLGKDVYLPPMLRHLS